MSDEQTDTTPEPPAPATTRRVPRHQVLAMSEGLWVDHDDLEDRRALEQARADQLANRPPHW